MKNTQLTILLSLLSLTLFAQISTSEKQALQDLYSSTNGDQWNNSWDLSQPVDKWSGLTIKNDKVTSISLMFNNMEGKLPSSLNQLKHLEVLELSYEDAMDMVKSGEIKDAKTIMLLQYARIHGLLS